ncbi:hypothetical protein MMC10_004297 [Thelotrema lepadinum]|nr:hypothetical protein [Thelotrema lepadinum]
MPGSVIVPCSVRIFCVPSEAGTHFAGQSKAPRAILDRARLGHKLQEAGFQVLLHNQILETPALKAAASWKPSPVVDGVRNEVAAMKVMTAVYDHASIISLKNDEFYHTVSLILGGDRSITPAVLAGLDERHQPGTRIGLIYFDGEVDLTLPTQAATGGSSATLDSMTLTHLTGRDGGLGSMKRFAKLDCTPLITNDNVVLFGFDPLQPSTEHWTYLVENGLKAFSRPTVQERPVESAEAALAWLKDRVDVIYLHFDVDAIDSGTFPLANYPHYAGIQYREAFQALRRFLRSPAVRGMILTGVNPNNDPTGTMTAQVVGNIVEGLKSREASGDYL